MALKKTIVSKYQRYILFAAFERPSLLIVCFLYRLHGDIVSCRRVFQRAVQTTVDDTEKLCGAFVCFEREEGNHHSHEFVNLLLLDQVPFSCDNT